MRVGAIERYIARGHELDIHTEQTKLLSLRVVRLIHLALHVEKCSVTVLLLQREQHLPFQSIMKGFSALERGSTLCRNQIRSSEERDRYYLMGGGKIKVKRIQKQ